MTVTEINKLTRDGGNGRNVYMQDPTNGAWCRVVAARTRGGQKQVKILTTGTWCPVFTTDKFKVSL